jgi:hypothetical protein
MITWVRCWNTGKIIHFYNVWRPIHSEVHSWLMREPPLLLRSISPRGEKIL